MSITIYGSPRSRTMRVLWMAEELSLEYSHVPVAFDDPYLKSLEFLRLNPVGSIPTLVDDGFAIGESLALNIYLAKRYGIGRGLYARTVQEEADIWRWSLWAQGHVEPWVQKDAPLFHRLEASEDSLTHGIAELLRALSVLNAVTAARTWLSGEQFGVADLNVAGVLSPSRASLIDWTGLDSARTWLRRCYARDAALAVRERFASPP